MSIYEAALFSSKAYKRPSRSRRSDPMSYREALFSAKQEFRAQHGIAVPDRQARYAATQPSRLRRDRLYLGGPADAHTANAHDFWKFRESAWAMDRDDAVPGRWVNRALDNILPLVVDPQTGEPTLDAYLKRRWVEWGEDPRLCDVSERHTWEQIERLVLRTSWIGGDCPVVLQHDAGRIQAVEPDRLVSPDIRARGADTDILHGVETDPATGRVLAYYFLKTRQGERSWNQRPLIPALSTEDYVRLTPYDDMDRPQVVLVHDPQRISEHRGVTIFHAGFDSFGMIEDTMYAELVKQQTASCIPVFVKSAQDVRWGSRDTSTTGDDGKTETIEQLVPGTVPRLGPGEEITGITGGNTDPDFEGAMRFHLRFAALQMGMPYSLAMLDTDKTTFHGYRGEYEQAKLTFRRIQRDYPSQFHRCAYRMKARQFLADAEGRGLERAIQRATKAGTLLNFRAQGNAWPYVQPLQDAQADELRKNARLASPRQISAERGRDHSEVIQECVEDRAAEIKAAVEAAKKLSEESGEEISWRDLLSAEEPAPAPTQPQPDEVPGQEPEGMEPEGMEPDEDEEE